MQLQSLAAKGNDGSCGKSYEVDECEPTGWSKPYFWPQLWSSGLWSQMQSSFLKMDFPRFVEGDNPLGWVYKAEHYFEFFHMEGEALQWFQWAKCLTNYLT